MHKSALAEIYPGMSELELTFAVCNNGLALPEQGLESPTWHLPVTWLGVTPVKLDMSDDLEATQAAQIKGVKRNMTYMLILPSPSSADVEAGYAMTPASFCGTFMRRELKAAGISLHDVLVTHALRFSLPETINAYKEQHKSSNAHFLLADLEFCKPDVVIACGAVVIKALFGRESKLENMRGNVMNLPLPSGHVCKVIPTVNPLSFIGSHANLTVFQSEIRRAYEVATGSYKPTIITKEHVICTTADEVEALCARIKAEKPRHVAFDTEWGNDVARDEYRYTLSIQLAWAAGKAAFIQLRKQETLPDEVKVVNVGKMRKDGTFRTKEIVLKGQMKCGIKMHSPEDESRIWKALKDLLLNYGIRADGHHLRVDVEQFNREGYNIDMCIPVGFDTMLVHHLLYGDESQGLDHLVRKYVPQFGAYWGDLNKWLTANGEKAITQFGYRDIPLSILIPYGLDDADATWQVAEKLEAALEENAGLKELYYNHVSWTSLHLLDVERQGILVDEERRMQLREIYQPVYDDFLKRLRELICWPDFSPASKQHMNYLLFGDHKYKECEKGKALCPEGAQCLHLHPVQDTSKFPMPWEDVVMQGLEDSKFPSTKAPVIEMLVSKLERKVKKRKPDNTEYIPVDEIKILRYLSAIGKFLSTYLHPIELNEFGVPEGGKGFHHNIRNDGRVTTRLSQLTETGRYTSSSANLQVSPKKQEAVVFEALIFHKFRCSVEEYKKRTFDGDKAKGKPAYDKPDRIKEEDRVHQTEFKTCYIPEEGYTFIEVDFKTAEVFVWAYCSGDAALIELVDSGRDMHSEVACRSFRLPPLAELDSVLKELRAGNKTPYNDWCENFKKEYKDARISAKCVVFGVMYGRQAAALVREISKTGVTISIEECQQIISGLATSFPTAWQWLVAGAEAAVSNEKLANAFGRYRYFTGASRLSSQDQAAVRRESKNSRIQGCVADLLAQAGIKLYKFKHLVGGASRAVDFKILIPIHDAFLIECKDEHVDKCKRLITHCMTVDNKIPGTNHNLNVDIELYKRWGEKLKAH